MRPSRILATAVPLLATLVVFAALASTASAASAGAPASSQALVDFAYGLKALRHGDAQGAVDRFTSAVAADPDDGTARHWLGLAYLQLGDGERAAREIEAALAARRPPGDRARARADLERARSAAGAAAAADTAAVPAYGGEAAGLAAWGEAARWEVRLSAAAGNDSNPLLLADGAVGVHGADVFAGPQSDRFADLGARIEVRPLVDRGGWSLGLAGEASQGRFGDLGFLDSDQVRAAAHLSWGGDPAGTLSGPLGYARVPLGNQRVALLLQAGVTADRVDGQRLRTTTEGAAALTFREGSAAATRLTVSAAHDDYADDPAGILERSGTRTDVAADQFFYFGRRNRYLRVGVAAGERAAGAAFDATTRQASVEVGLPLAPRWSLWLAGSARRTEFDRLESNPLFPLFFATVAREDTTTRAAAVLSWALTPRLLVSARASRVDRRAEFGAAAEQFLDLDYDRTVVSLGVRWYLMKGGGR